MGFLNWLKDKENKTKNGFKTVSQNFSNLRGKNVVTRPNLPSAEQISAKENANSQPKLSGIQSLGRSALYSLTKPMGQSEEKYTLGKDPTLKNTIGAGLGSTAAQLNPTTAAISGANQFGNQASNGADAKTLAKTAAGTAGNVVMAGITGKTVKIPAIDKVSSSAERLALYSGLRGLENAGIGISQRLQNEGRVGNLTDIGKDAAAGAIFNTVASPFQVFGKPNIGKSQGFRGAAREVVDNVKSKVAQERENDYISNLTTALSKTSYRPTVDKLINEFKYTKNLTPQTKKGLGNILEKETNKDKIYEIIKNHLPEEIKVNYYKPGMQPGHARFPGADLIPDNSQSNNIPLNENGKIPTTNRQDPQLHQPSIAKTGLSQSNQISTPITPIDTSFNVNSYINKQKMAQKASEGKIGIKGKLGSVLQEVKTKLVDSNAPIEDVLSKAEKEGKFNVRPTNDIRYQIDRVLRSDSIATQSLKDSGIDKIIRNVDDVDAFNQYLIAKQAKDVAVKGVKTGRNLVDDDNFINAVADKYEPMAQQVYAHNRKMLDTLTDSGMISKELSDQLKKEYPNYVPLNRIFSESEQGAINGFGKSGAVASVGTQKVVKRLQGSERDIENPLESILTKTSQVFEQAEKNKAAQMLASYKDLPNNPFNLEEITTKSPGESTISFFDNGVKRTFKADPEIAKAAKNMSQQQIGLLGQMFAIPTRILKLGATGLNLPFVASNLVKDQVFSTITSDRALSTSIANPVNFAKSLFTVFKKGQLYDDWVRSGSSFTSFDLSRNSAKPTVEAMRAGKNVGSRVLYTAKHPQSFIRSLEDLIGKSEELTRVQQFNGMKNQLLKEGRTLEDATILAANASRNNTANFSRRGEWGTVLNSAIPYLNAGIQGSRSLVGSITKHPGQAIFKIAGLVLTPVAMATAWNLKDTKRKEAYNDIPEYEKQGNIIIIPENPVKDSNGRWNAIKIPLTPGLSNLTSIVRRQFEGVDNFDPESFARVAGDLLTAGTSVNPLDTRQTLSQITPQGLKPGIESATNTNLYTGQKIVPDSLKDLPEDEQVKKNTSGTARVIGKITGSSPLKVENTVRTMGSGVGQQLLNASDKILASTGKIPQEQIGGRGLGDSFSNRFNSVAGGQNESKVWDQITKQEQEKKKDNKDRINRYLNGDNTAFNGLTSQQKSSLIRSAEEQQATSNLSSLEKTIYNMSDINKQQLAQSNPEMMDTIQQMTDLKSSLSAKKTTLPKLKISKSKKKSSSTKKVKFTKVKLASAPKTTKIKIKSPKVVKAKKYKIKKGVV